MTRASALALVFALLGLPGAAVADPPGASGSKAPAPPPPAAQAASDEDLEPQPTQPDFTLVNLPTALPLPRHKMAFRVTHRFTRALNEGDFGDALSDAFGLDSGASIGLELRFAPARRLQVGVLRTSDKSVNFFGQYNVLQQGGAAPVSVAAVAAVEGTGNFTDEYSPSVGVVVARQVGSVAAVYAVPRWIGNANLLNVPVGTSDNTFVIGVGARVRLARGLYVVGEASPRVAGFKGAFPDGPVAFREGGTVAAFAIEKQVGGHAFQVNVSNAFVTTPAQMARGRAPGSSSWYLGFNISRKFY
jgi:hypothetical protein